MSRGLKRSTPVETPDWTQSKTLALASQQCVYCFGMGLMQTRGTAMRPCHCVERRIFRACYERFRECVTEEKPIGRVSLESNRGRLNFHNYSMKNEEYAADFVLVAKRVLGEGTLAHRLFRFHFLLGADCGLCCRKLGLDRGEFFHEVYRVEQRLGKAFAELKPYALFPLDEYFGGAKAKVDPLAAKALPVQRFRLTAASAA